MHCPERHLYEGGVDNAGGHAVDSEPPVGPLCTQRLCDLHHGSLAGVVRNLFLRVRHQQARHASRVYYAAVAARQHVPPLRLHMTRYFKGQTELCILPYEKGLTCICTHDFQHTQMPVNANQCCP